jgi:acyl-CoA thioester hydrolase
VTGRTASHERFRLRERLRVRWAETDAQGIVFNGHYLTFFDVAITEYWRAIGLPYPEALQGTGVDLFAVKSTVEYFAPARYDDVIEVGCRASDLGRSSIAFELAIWRDGEAITRGQLVYVCADAAARKSVAIPDKYRRAIETWESSAS